MTKTELQSPPGPPPERLEPPVDLEERVVRALRGEGLLASTSIQEPSMKRIHIAWTTAATILLVAGFALGRSWLDGVAPQDRSSPENAAHTDKRPLFALMLYEDSNYQVATAGEDRVAEYTAWAGSLAQRGYLVDGAKLSDSGLLLAQAQPHAEAVPTSHEGVLAGYFVIRAADRDEAERIARECPHLKYQGTISLRAIEM